MNIENKKFLITGGTGSFGKTVCQFLLKKKVEENGTLKELRKRDHYVKPSVKRKIMKSAAPWATYLSSGL